MITFLNLAWRKDATEDSSPKNTASSPRQNADDEMTQEKQFPVENANSKWPQNWMTMLVRFKTASCSSKALKVVETRHEFLRYWKW